MNASLTNCSILLGSPTWSFLSNSQFSIHSSPELHFVCFTLLSVFGTGVFCIVCFFYSHHQYLHHPNKRQFLKNLYLAKYGVFAIQFMCCSKSEKELTLIIIGSSISHCNQPSAHKAKPLMKFILREQRVT